MLYLEEILLDGSIMTQWSSGSFRVLLQRPITSNISLSRISDLQTEGLMSVDEIGSASSEIRTFEASLSALALERLLPFLRNVIELTLVMIPWSEGTLRYVASMPMLKRLKLYLYYGSTILEDELMIMAEKCPHIEYLGLLGATCEDPDVVKFEGLAALRPPTLEKINDGTIEKIASKLPNLMDICLFNTHYWLTKKSLISLATQCKNIRSINIGANVCLDSFIKDSLQSRV